MSLREVPEDGRVSKIWPIARGVISQTQLDAMVKSLHKTRCSSFDGARVRGPGPLSDHCRIQHEASIAHAIEAIHKAGLVLTVRKVVPKAEGVPK